MTVPNLRINELNHHLPSLDGDFVLYWMTSFRRPNWNFALDRAVELANELGKPILVFEPLRAGYEWNCDRFHQFVINGMVDNAAAFKTARVEYYPYVEQKPGDGSGLIESLAKRSCAVVTDDFPCFFIPQLLRVMSRKIHVRFEAIDSNGLLPMRAADKIHSRAHFFRGFLQKVLTSHVSEMPNAAPLSKQTIPRAKINLQQIQKQWPKFETRDSASVCETLSINHGVKPIENAGGVNRAAEILDEFIQRKLTLYPEDRNYPEKKATSGFSPYLHFGHLSAHEVFCKLMKSDDWSIEKIAEKPTKKVEGWWGVSDYIEPFLDQLTTWRELGFNMAWQDKNFDQFESLPPWAQKTLAEQENDVRSPCYTLEQFDLAETHDPLWNAAQNQLVSEGCIHNYLRMLWGKKILHWSASPREALRIMIELNNKYALDGRDPNSYSGIFWTLGRYDRAWGPVRPIFGKIRYMASENTARKFPVKNFVKQYGSRQKGLFA